MVRDALEVLLIVVSLAGAWWAYRNAREADHDYIAVTLSGQNGLLLLTAQAVRAQQRAWGIVAALLLVILVAGIAPQQPWLSAVRRVSFLGILLATVIGSGRADRQRRALMVHAREEERGRIEQRRRSTDR